MVPQQPDPNNAGFGELGMTNVSVNVSLCKHNTNVYQPADINLDFSALENPEIFENFDFDSFLNTDTDAAGFGFDPSITYSTDGVETGTDGL